MRNQDVIPGIDAWDPWHPDEAMKQLAGAPHSWCVVGGWALDLWLGRQTRPHHDLEIAILRADFFSFRVLLKRFRVFVAAEGATTALPPESPPDPEHHQIWVLDEYARVWRMGIFLEPGDNRTWVFRRDERIYCSRSQMIAISSEGVPYLKPEAVLLYKAKATRAKNDEDFRACAALMASGARAWLKNALISLHPAHRWIDDLG
jgi:hypothetical protein